MKFKLKDPGSAITHGIAFLLAAVGAAPLLIRSSEWSDHIHIVALGVFILTMMLLYAASTLYHSVDSTAKVNRRLKKLDHMMIFVMIAGSYTPVCLIVLHNNIGMGWLCVLAFMPIIHALPKAGFGWLLAGGIIYTIGGVIYALKLPIFNAKHKNFGSHEIFHVFIMLGSACHFIVMYCFVANMPI